MFQWMFSGGHFAALYIQVSVPVGREKVLIFLNVCLGRDYFHGGLKPRSVCTFCHIEDSVVSGGCSC